MCAALGAGLLALSAAGDVGLGTAAFMACVEACIQTVAMAAPTLTFITTVMHAIDPGNPEWDADFPSVESPSHSGAYLNGKWNMHGPDGRYISSDQAVPVINP
jgi:hypothetical protein